MISERTIIVFFLVMTRNLASSGSEVLVYYLLVIESHIIFPRQSRQENEEFELRPVLDIAPVRYVNDGLLGGCSHAELLASYLADEFGSSVNNG